MFGQPVEVHAPNQDRGIVKHTPMTTMVYDNKDQLINTTYAIKVGVSTADRGNTFTIWFYDGIHKHHMARAFLTKQEAEEFLQSIYNIKE